MGFLAPAFLALAAFAGVPLLVHLLRRRLGQTVDFPAVRYLARMEREHSRDLKVRHRLLLALRLMAVLALALAAARPLLRLAGLGHAPVALAIVLDNSMSSGAAPEGRATLDRLREGVVRLLDDLSPEDRGWVVTADGRVIGGPPAVVREQVGRLAPYGGAGDLSAATRQALRLAASGSPRASVVALVSDGQRGSFQTDSVVAAARTPVVALLQGGVPVRNHGVVEARAVPVRWTPGGAVTLAVAGPDSSRWRVVLEGRTVARGTLPPAPAGAPVTAEVPLASQARGWIRGSVELEADALRADDSRVFAVRVAPPPAVQVRPEAGPFLAAALATLADQGRLTRAEAGRSRVGGAVPVTVAGAQAGGLSGPVFLTAPSDPLRVGDANRQLARLGIPWRFGALSRGAVLARVADAGGERPDSSAPSTRAFEGTTVRDRYPLVWSAEAGASGSDRRTATADTIAVAGGAPWVVAGDGYVLIGSPLTVEATDLPLRVAFVPWLADALARRLGEEGRYIEATPGTRLRGLQDVTGLERPDGSVVALEGGRLTVPATPGVYFFRRQAARTGALVVNPEPGESDVGVGPPEATLASLVSGADVVALTDAPAWRRAVFDRAIGQPLLVPLLLLALLALLAEAWVSRR